MIIQEKEFDDGVLAVRVDYGRSEHAGASGCFQIVDVYIDGVSDDSITDKLDIDFGKHYLDISDFLRDLGVNPTAINYRVEVD